MSECMHDKLADVRYRHDHAHIKAEGNCSQKEWHGVAESRDTHAQYGISHTVSTVHNLIVSRSRTQLQQTHQQQL